MKQCRDCGLTKPLVEFNKSVECRLGVRPECKQCQAKRRKLKYKENAVAIIAQTRVWAVANPKKRSEISSRYYYSNLEKEQDRSRNYAKNNPEIKRAQCARRRAAIARAMPKWLSELQHDHINLFYEAATNLAKDLQIAIEVDHIVPLKGKIVSGLHVPWNLQVLQRDGIGGNRSKSNKAAS